MHAAILKYFCAVARAGSIRRASDELHVATSALSRQIQKLEEELDTELFERLPKGLRLTRAGEEVLRHADSTLLEFDMLKSEIAALKGVQSGQVRIVCLDSLLVKFLPEQILAFHKIHPGVEFRVQSGAHGRVTNMVAEGEADIGITFNVSYPDDTKMVSDVAMPLMAMVSTSHPLASRSSVTLAECAQYNLLLQMDTEPIRSIIDIELSVLQRSGRSLVTSNHLMMLRPMIMSGIGVAFYTPIGMIDEIAAGSIAAVPLKGTKLGELRLGILVSRRRKMTHAAQAMLKQLSTSLADLEQTMP